MSRPRSILGSQVAGEVVAHRTSASSAAPAPSRKGVRSPALSLTSAERQHLRAGLRNLRRAFGTWACLADAMGVPETTVRKGNGAVLALRAARVAGVSVESILSGGVTLAGACSTCGHRAGTGRLAANGGAS